MSDGPFRWALLGYGDLAEKRVAAALQSATGCALESVWGRNPERTARFAGQHQIPRAARSLDEIWDSQPDAVYVCTPPHSHADYACAALERGIPVLVEKPMAVTDDECRRMVSAAQQSGVQLGVAYYRRAFPKMQRVRQLIDDGVLGIPVWVGMAAHSWFAPTTDDPKAWRVDPQQSGGAGALADIGVHRLDLLDYWFGGAQLTDATFTRLVQDYAVEDGSALTLSLPGGAPVQAFFSWNSKTWVDRVELVGTEGRIVLEPLDSPNLTVIRGREREDLSIPAPENAHLPCVEDFVAACRDGKSPLCDGDAGARTSALLAAAIRAAL